MIHPPAPGKGWWAARIFERRRGLESFLGTASTLWRLPTGGWLSDDVGVKQLEMELVENAYDFVNESLRAARQAERRARAWKFAIVHIVQAIELLLKERLRREHPILIYENVDRKKNTVSLAQAVERITGLGVELTAKELQAVEKARRWRGLMIHYEFQVPVAEAKAVYSRLFEFATAFHSDHIGGDLHGHIEPELWPKEAELIEFFHREFVLYHGTEVHREIPRQILEAQGIVSYVINGESFARIRYGSETGGRWTMPACGDCAVGMGQLHLLRCDIEECPRCIHQALSCPCVYAEVPEKVPLLAT